MCHRNHNNLSIYIVILNFNLTRHLNCIIYIYMSSNSQLLPNQMKCTIEIMLTELIKINNNSQISSRMEMAHIEM